MGNYALLGKKKGSAMLWVKRIVLGTIGFGLGLLAATETLALVGDGNIFVKALGIVIVWAALLFFALPVFILLTEDKNSDNNVVGMILFCLMASFILTPFVVGTLDLKEGNYYTVMVLVMKGVFVLDGLFYTLCLQGN